MRTCHSDAPSKARGLKLGPSLHLQVYCVYASSEGSGEYVPSLIAGAISTEVSSLVSSSYLHVILNTWNVVYQYLAYTAKIIYDAQITSVLLKTFI